MKKKKGQAVIEYVLLVIMIAVTMAVVIRNINEKIYFLWTGLARQIAKPCAECSIPAAPEP